MQQNVWGSQKRKKEIKIRKVQCMIIYFRCKKVPLRLVEMCKRCRDNATGLQSTSLHFCRAALGEKRPKQLQRVMVTARHEHNCPLCGCLSVCLQGADTHRLYWLPFPWGQAYLPHSTVNVDISLGLRNEWSGILGVKHCEIEGLGYFGGYL